ncbi:MAG: hypothetical protein HY894_06650 [Deltaproteobacteria bacterium]|nr:hypothetical protein [Deltaproteobacteria bacterium]
MRGTRSDNGGYRLKDILLLALVPVWAIGSISLFRAEAKTLGLTPSILKMTEDELNYAVSGPVYDLTAEVSLRLPGGGPVYLLTPPDEAEAGVAAGKARYYLYPRRVIEVPYAEAESLRGLRPGDCLVFYMPARYRDAALDGLLSAFGFEKSYDYADAKGRQGIYVKRGA